MTEKNEIVVKEIVESIRRLYRAVYQDSAKMSRRFGLTSSQSGVLRTLFDRGPLSSADLSRSLFVTPANITGIIDRLEKKGFVERVRKEGDRRVALITLTDTGLELSQQLPDPIEKKLTSGLAHLDEESVANLNESMVRVLNLMNAEEVPELPIELTTDNGLTPTELSPKRDNPAGLERSPAIKDDELNNT